MNSIKLELWNLLKLTFYFIQVYFHTSESRPRCLHEWIPHGGKGVTSFFFLDNLTKHSKE